jgi:cellulose synthase/poly-beta-1,6-N-acetylglucosamine synthase-like glycosyltransferase
MRIALYKGFIMGEFFPNELQQWYNQFWYIVPVGIIGVISWSVWLVRWSISRCYRPLVNNFRTTTSVVVPSYREDPDVLVRCLDTWLAEGPDEVIIVVDIEDTAVIERLRIYEDERLRVIVFKHQGKRSALGVGIRAAQHEIVVLADSDTAWEKGLLAALQMPFSDPQVGGVGTRQNAYERQSSIWRVVADWLVNIRYLDYVPACSMAGGVACLSGRTAAYRRSAIMPVLHQLEYEYFLGRLCVAGDDGRLTWLVLSSGYRTVYQSSARASSMFPRTWRAFVRQRIRWSRNSYRCYLTAIQKGWLWQQPLITQITVLQILLTPLSMGFAMGYLALSVINANWGLLLFGLVWVLLGRALRGISHLREHPRDIVALPLLALVTIIIALPIKTWAALTMNTHGWLTRQHTQIGGEGQTEASLYHSDDRRLTTLSGRR